MLLSLPYMPRNYINLNIAAKVIKVLKEFGLIKEFGKVGYFILNNANNNGTAITEFISLYGLNIDNGS